MKLLSEALVDNCQNLVSNLLIDGWITEDSLILHQKFRPNTTTQYMQQQVFFQGSKWKYQSKTLQFLKWCFYYSPSIWPKNPFEISQLDFCCNTPKHWIRQHSKSTWFVVLQVVNWELCFTWLRSIVRKNLICKHHSKANHNLLDPTHR